MKKIIREYFLTFGAPDHVGPAHSYWQEDPNLFQVIFGLLLLPIVLVGVALYFMAKIKIRL